MNLSEMAQNHATPPSQQPAKNDSTLKTTPEDMVPQTWQYPTTLPLRAPLETKSNLVPAARPKAPMTRANWVNTFWADLSGQLRRMSVISNDLFDGLLLKRNTATGSLILGELRNKYEQLGNDRNLATVRVLSPVIFSDTWQLLWTTKRESHPNGRQFHSETTIDPINNESYLQFEDNPVQTVSVAHFSLPPFMQDYGPGPSKFDPELEDEFDAVLESIMRDGK